MPKITRHGDTGTPELLRQKGIEITIVEGQPKARVRNISPLHTYYKRSHITTAQYSAGNRLYECWITGWFGFSNCEVKERTQGGKAPELTEKQVHAMHQYQRGMAYVAAENWLVKQVCLNEISIAQLEASARKRKILKQRLSIALDNLARGYGYL